MMRKFILYKLLGLALIVIGYAACNTASQDVEPVISPAGYPVPTFTAVGTTSVDEGAVYKYTITLDKMLDRSLTFSMVQTGGTATEEDDYEVEPAVLPPYTNTGELVISVIEDDFPEDNETLDFEVEISSLGERYLVNPSTVYPTGSLTLNNVNDPSVLTIAFGWANHDDDIDCFAYFGASDWGYAASSDNPEILTTIWPDDPNGTYYFGIDPYYVTGTTVDYTISIGHPDGTVQFFTGVFDTGNLDSYTVDTYNSWGDYPTYRLLEIVNTDGVFTITHLN